MDTHNHEKLNNIMEFQAKMCHCAKVIPYLKGTSYPSISYTSSCEMGGIESIKSHSQEWV